MKDIIKIKIDSGQKRNILLILLSCLSILFIHSIANSEQEAKGNGQEKDISAEQVFESDLEKYEKAVEKDPDSDTANYNLGTAYYRKGEYEKSFDSFMKSLNTEDREIEAKAIYNMANSKYQTGSLQAGRDLNSAIGHYKESLDYYRRAMELDESDRDAKYNYELVERKLKILLDEMKNRQQQEQDQDQNEDKDKESKEGQGEGEQQQQQQEDDQQQSEKKDQASERKDDEETGAGQEQGDQEMQSAGREEESPEQMSPEEAQMLLESYGQDEAREEVKQKMKGRYGEVLKDW